MKRPLLLTAATLVFTWINVATILWIRDAGGFVEALAHLWAAARADWLLLAILTDAGVFVLLALAWLWRNTGDRAWSTPRRLACVAAVVAVGSPALLAYLALSPRRRHGSPSPSRTE